eukprot:1196020-Prorocentrum_minimum.AAC.5
MGARISHCAEAVNPADQAAALLPPAAAAALTPAFVPAPAPVRTLVSAHLRLLSGIRCNDERVILRSLSRQELKGRLLQVLALEKKGFPRRFPACQCPTSDVNSSIWTNFLKTHRYVLRVYLYTQSQSCDGVSHPDPEGMSVTVPIADRVLRKDLRGLPRWSNPLYYVFESNARFHASLTCVGYSEGVGD